jgi:hypothetical protein
LLSDEEVPVHVVHGSADTLVPYQQALELCGAIDDSVFATDIVDPLTMYACGADSQVQIIKDAEHALELGVCLGSICPAGDAGGATRIAVAAAIETSYLWLMEDPPVESPPPPVANEEESRSGSGALSWLTLFCLLMVIRRRVSIKP